jgi:hypothetical protein
VWNLLGDVFIAWTMQQRCLTLLKAKETEVTCTVTAVLQGLRYEEIYDVYWNIIRLIIMPAARAISFIFGLAYASHLSHRSLTVTTQYASALPRYKNGACNVS